MGQRSATRQALIGFTDCSASLVNQCRSVAPQVLLAVAGVCVTCNEDVATAPIDALIEDAVSCTEALRNSHKALLSVIDQCRNKNAQAIARAMPAPTTQRHPSTTPTGTQRHSSLKSRAHSLNLNVNLHLDLNLLL